MRDYLEFFGFKDDPFKITPDSSYFFLSEAHQEALSALRYLLETEEGFAVVIGEPGTGKTLTVRKFVEELPENIRYAYILFPNLSPEELFEAILEDLNIKAEGGTKNKLFSLLRDYLIESRSKGEKVLVIIDEAQNLPIETLEELRILSNLETRDTKLLQIILLGQPELEEKLNSSALRQLKQRITVFTKLRNFSEEETRAYTEYRISKAGYGNLRINPKVYKKLYRYSLGIPRVINILMERSLMAAFVEGSREIKPHHIDRSAESIGLRVERRSFSASYIMLTVFLITLAGIGVFFYKQSIFDSPKKVIQKAERSKKVFVRVQMLNMREAPTPNSPVVYVLKEGDPLEILKKGPETWVLARFKGEGFTVEGWVNSKYLSSQ